jgi:hypothetical protein
MVINKITIASINFVIGNENPSVGETIKSKSVTNSGIIRNGETTRSGGINFSTQTEWRVRFKLN